MQYHIWAKPDCTVVLGHLEKNTAALAPMMDKNVAGLISAGSSKPHAHAPIHVIISRERASIFADYVITTALRDPVTDYKFCCDPVTDYQNPPCDRNVTAVVALTTVSTGVTTPCARIIKGRCYRHVIAPSFMRRSSAGGC